MLIPVAESLLIDRGACGPVVALLSRSGKCFRPVGRIQKMQWPDKKARPTKRPGVPHLQLSYRSPSKLAQAKRQGRGRNAPERRSRAEVKELKTSSSSRSTLLLIAQTSRLRPLARGSTRDRAFESSTTPRVLADCLRRRFGAVWTRKAGGGAEAAKTKQVSSQTQHPERKAPATPHCPRDNPFRPVPPRSRKERGGGRSWARGLTWSQRRRRREEEDGRPVRPRRRAEARAPPISPLPPAPPPQQRPPTPCGSSSRPRPRRRGCRRACC